MRCSYCAMDIPPLCSYLTVNGKHYCGREQCHIEALRQIKQGHPGGA